MGTGLASGAPIEWPPIEARVRSYLNALGVTHQEELASLLARVREQLDSRSACGPIEDPAEAAIEETLRLLDRWLIGELGELGTGDGRITVQAARAAVIAGKIPGWTANWAGLSSRPLARTIVAATIPSVPEPSLMKMETNQIVLCCSRLSLKDLQQQIVGNGRKPVDSGGES